MRCWKLLQYAWFFSHDCHAYNVDFEFVSESQNELQYAAAEVQAMHNARISRRNQLKNIA